MYVLSRINKDWLQGRNKRGKEGQFPASFVQPERESSATTMEISGIDGHNKVYYSSHCNLRISMEQLLIFA